MKLPLNSIISFQFIKASVISTARKLLNGFVLVCQLLTGPSHRQAALVYLPALALALSLYLLLRTNEDTCVETVDGSGLLIRHGLSWCVLGNGQLVHQSPS